MVAYVYAACAGNVRCAFVALGAVVYVTAVKVRFVEVFEEQFACPRCFAVGTFGCVVETNVLRVGCSYVLDFALFVYVVNHISGYGVFPRRTVHFARAVFGYVNNGTVLWQVGFVCSEVGRTAEVAFATGNVGCKFRRGAAGFVNQVGCAGGTCKRAELCVTAVVGVVAEGGSQAVCGVGEIGGSFCAGRGEGDCIAGAVAHGERACAHAGRGCAYVVCHGDVVHGKGGAVYHGSAGIGIGIVVYNAVVHC